MVAQDDLQWRSYLRFRDMLSADQGLRTRYTNLKKALQEQFSHDRKSYTAAKHDFIRGVLWHQTTV
jgi:GrpB-like predicted nucleotidyltransferase (UPF0157 family)